MADKECKSKCVGAGSMLMRQYTTFRSDAVSPILFHENLLLKADDMKIPHSELAMHMKAADKSIIAFFVTSGGSAHIVYDDDGCCEFTSGMDSELLSPELKRAVKGYMPEKEPEHTENRMIV